MYFKMTKKYRRVSGLCTFLIFVWFSITFLNQQTKFDYPKVEANPNQDTKSLQNYKSDNSLCRCKSHGSTDVGVSHLPQSTCSDFSTERGTNQKVVSYSYYNQDIKDKKGSENRKRYLEGLIGRTREVKMLYPGWIMRVYHNVTAEDVYGAKILCNTYCNNDHIDLCDVRNLPVLENKLEEQNGMFWRFLPLGDPTVKIFISRDLDSVIQERELDAVSEWLKSNSTFHVMRDHPSHKTVILGGLWGTKVFQRREELVRMGVKLLSSSSVHKYGHDQNILKQILWPLVKTDVLQHDSFNCYLKAHKNSVPFPTIRKIDFYVGWGPVAKDKPLNVFREVDCPPQCRPLQHPDWTKC